MGSKPKRVAAASASARRRGNEMNLLRACSRDLSLGYAVDNPAFMSNKKRQIDEEVI